MQNAEISLLYLKKRNVLPNTPIEEKEQMILFAEKKFFFYEPYKNIFIRVHDSKKVGVRNMLKYSKLKEVPENLEPRSYYSNKQIQEVNNKLERGLKVSSIFSNSSIYWLFGMVAGFVTFLLSGLYWGIFILTFSVYLGFSLFDSTNRLVEKRQGQYLTAIKWRNNKAYYFIRKVMFLILSVFLAYYLSSSWIVLVIFFVLPELILIKPLTKFICSKTYLGTDISIYFNAVVKEHQNVKKKEPFKVVIDGIKGPTDIWADEGPEEYILEYSTPKKLLGEAFIILNQTEKLALEELERFVRRDDFNSAFRELIKNDLAEFIYYSASSTGFPVEMVIAKDSYYTLYEFKGNYEENILLSYHDNGEIEDYMEYRYGCLNGVKKTFYENGGLEVELKFKEGRLEDGEYIWFNENGTIRMKGKIKSDFKNPATEKDFYDSESDKRIGKWEFCDEQGKPLKIVKYLADGKREEIFQSPEYHKNLIWL